MSGGGGGSSSTTQTTKVEPAAQVAPYLAPFMQHASAVAMRPWEAYAGKRIADFTQDQLAGFDMARQNAQQAQQSLQGANQYLNQTIGGQYLGYSPQQVQAGTNPYYGQNNPYLQQQINAAQQDIVRSFNNSVANNTDAAFARAGAFGGSAWQQAQAENANQLAQNLGRVANDMRMQDYQLQAQLGESDLARQLQAGQFNAALGDQAYQAERARMLQAAGMLPGMAQAGYSNAQALLGIGDAQQAREQGKLDLAYQDWLAEQNYPYQQLDVMGNAIRTIMGGGGTTTQIGPNPYQRNSTAAALGGALSGGAMGGMIAGASNGAIGGPLGIGIGAGLGLLGGLFG